MLKICLQTCLHKYTCIAAYMSVFFNDSVNRNKIAIKADYQALANI